LTNETHAERTEFLRKPRRKCILFARLPRTTRRTYCATPPPEAPPSELHL